MNTNILSLITWRDLQEFFIETSRVMVEIDESDHFFPPFSVSTEKMYNEVLHRLREKYQCLPPVSERYEKVLRAAETAVGKKLSKERGTGNTIIRCFVSFQLHQEGYSYTAIGRVLHRDHSSITHHCRVVENMLSVPGAYKEDMEAFGRFQELLAEQD